MLDARRQLPIGRSDAGELQIGDVETAVGVDAIELMELIG
jgi:hypothetical protein